SSKVQVVLITILSRRKNNIGSIREGTANRIKGLSAHNYRVARCGFAEVTHVGPKLPRQPIFAANDMTRLRSSYHKRQRRHSDSRAHWRGTLKDLVENRNALLTGQPGEGIAGEIVSDPVLDRCRADAVIELDRGPVPVEHLPVDSGAAMRQHALRQI